MPEDNKSGYFARPVVTTHPHDGAVRSVELNKSLLVSGGFDGTIALYDLKSNRNIGSLAQHKDSVDALALYNNAYLLSGSMDQTLCLWRCSDWALAKQFAGHTGAITGIALSKTGKLALTIGKDDTLRMWNLLRGHNAKSKKLGFCPSFIGLTDDSLDIIIGYKAEVTIIHAETEEVIHVFEHSSQVTSYSLFNDVLWVGTIDGHIYAWNIKDEKQIGVYNVSKKRIKFIGTSEGHIAVLTSDGEAIIGKVSQDYDVDVVLQWDVKMRITCGFYV